MSGKKEKKLVFSAEFKRDYIALGALSAFFLILIGEVTLAIWIPAYLQRENSMGREVARYKMAESLDSLRYRIKTLSAKEKDGVALAELQLLRWDADLWAEYLRREKQYLSDEDVAELTRRFQQEHAFLNFHAAKKKVSRENRLNTSGYIDSLLKSKGK